MDITGDCSRVTAIGTCQVSTFTGSCNLKPFRLGIIAPQVSNPCLVEALQLELNYLKKDLAANAGDRSDKAFVHNAYAVLTACRILYSTSQKTLASKEQACGWAMETVPIKWRALIRSARANRLKSRGSTTPQLEQDAMRFVEFVTDDVARTNAQRR